MNAYCGGKAKWVYRGKEEDEEKQQKHKLKKEEEREEGQEQVETEQKQRERGRGRRRRSQGKLPSASLKHHCCEHLPLTSSDAACHCPPSSHVVMNQSHLTL